MTEEEKEWVKNFINRAPEDGPRDTSHGAVQSQQLGIGRAGTGNLNLQKMKTKTIENFEALEKKKEIEKPLYSSLEQSVVKNIEAAKHTLRNMRERQKYGPLIEKIREKDVSLIELKNIEPSKWRNVPVPLTDFCEKVMRTSLQSSSIIDGLKNYNDDLVSILQHFFTFFDASTDEVRTQVSNKFLLLS